MKTAWFALSLLCYMNARTQGVIQGKIHSTSAIEFRVYAPFEGRYYNHELPTSMLKVDSGQSFQIPVQVHTPVFIRVSFDMFPLFLFAEPGDTISFDARISGSKAPNDMSWIRFSGKNASGQEYFNNFFLFPYMTSKFSQLWDQFNGKKTASELMADIRRSIEKSLTGFDSLEQSTILSPTFIHLARNTGKASLLNEALKRFQRKGVIQSRYTRSVLDVCIKEIFDLLNPIDSSLFSGVLSKMYAVSYLEEIERKTKGLASVDEISDSVWKPALKRNYTISAPFVPYLYGLKNPVTQHSWGDMLLAVAGLFPESVSLDDLEAYEWKYPGNIYSPLIRKRLNISREGVSGPGINMNSYLLLDTNQIIRSLKEITDKHLQQQVVLVDIWATWCIPCKMEFQQNDSLDAFLNKNQVKRLYISIDNPSALPTWKSNISYFRLEGHHILAGKELQKDIQAKIFGLKQAFSVPRYFIINRKGEVVVPDAYRPSQTLKLIEQIRKHLE